MEILIIILVLGIGAYLFLKGNTGRGIEAVRAHVFLGGMEAGVSVAEANHVASFDMTNAPTDIIQSAMTRIKHEYNGKQIPMIAEAYAKGMKSNLPMWTRSLYGLSS